MGFMDVTVQNNDDGCNHGADGQLLAERNAADEAIRATKSGIQRVRDGKQSNRQAITEVHKLPSGHPVVHKMLNFLGGWVVNTLSGNIRFLGKSIHALGNILKKIGHFGLGVVKAAVSGLKWIGSKISHFFGLYDVRALEAAISAPKAVAVLPAPPSVTPNLKVPSVVKFPVVMVAGMVTMLAMLVAGMRQWKKWNTSVVSMETDKMLVVDVE